MKAVVSIALVAAAAMLVITVNGDAAGDWEAKYKSFTCNKGYTGVLQPAYLMAERTCKNAGISDPYCFRVCLWNTLGIFHEGKYNKQASDAHIANQFDSPDIPLIAKWQEDTSQCIEKHGKNFPTAHIAHTGQCGTIKPLHDCLVASRTCK